jgi:hypothetical protein
MADTPQLDSRSFDVVVAQTEALATVYTSGAWRPRRDGSLDLGGVVIRLFGAMVDHAIKQLNKVPGKYQRAFTELLGAVRLGARAARAAITFELDDGTRTTTVPAGAQIASASDDGGGEPAVFETELDLALTRAQLAAVVVHDPARARYTERTSHALGLDPRPYDALGAPAPLPLEPDPENHAVEHEVYVAFDPLALRGATIARVTAVASSELPAQPVQWAGFGDGAWADLPPVSTAGNAWRLVADAERIGAADVAGAAVHWLRGSFPAPPPPLRLTAEIDIAVAGAPLEAAFANGQPADFTRDVLVFGERPRAGDVFYLASDDAFAIANATVTLAVALTQGGNASSNLELRWEAWDGRQATLLGTSKPASTGAAPFTDTTQAFTQSGSVTFRLGAAIPRSVIRGVTSRWVRVRIVAGNYGTDLTASVGANNTVTITPASFRPPALASATLSWTGTIAAAPARLVRRTALTFEDVTPAAGGEVPLYYAAPELAHGAAAEVLPALHLGFDRAFEPAVMTLYVQVAAPPAPSPLAYTQPPPPRSPARVAWEYWTGTRWAELTVEDGTRALARSGLVRFLPPADARPLAQFGRALHWLRARALEAAFAPMPRLGRISTNTVWASHAHTTTGEVLGASNGARDQTFTLSQTPVLDGQRIEVGEPEPPTAAERARLEAESGGDSSGGDGDDLVTVEQPAVGPPIYWVRWRPVADFYSSGPRDRHYTFDAATGRITFGDGTRGMIPPTGQQNVRAARYRSGGGIAGNVGAGVLAQLKTTVPLVRGATNREPAVGGAELESMPAMMDRAARTVRHGGRAVTAADYVDLALEASSAIGRAVVLTPSFVPVDQGEEPDTGSDALCRDGQVMVVIVPTTLRPGTAPTTNEIAEVEDYLRARSAPGARLDVTGPSWVAADITVHLVARSLAESDAVLAHARAAIARLFDPMLGGDGRGWPFGRRPRKSDVLACIDVIPGLDHASYIDVRCEAPFDVDDLDPDTDDPSIDELSLVNRLLVYARTITVTHPQAVHP